MESKEAVTDMEPQDKWLTIEELSGYLKMSRSKLYQMAQKGELPGSKIGTQWRFDRDGIDDWGKSKRPAAGKKTTGGKKRQPRQRRVRMKKPFVWAIIFSGRGLCVRN